MLLNKYMTKNICLEKGFRKGIALTIDEKVLLKAREIQDKIGAPISRQFELAWIEKYGEVATER